MTPNFIPFFLLFVAVVPVLAKPDFSAVRAYLDESIADGTVAGGSVLVHHRGGVVLETGLLEKEFATQIKPNRFIDRRGAP